MHSIENSMIDFISKEDISRLEEVKKAIDIVAEQEKILNDFGIELIVKFKDA